MRPRLTSIHRSIVLLLVLLPINVFAADQPLIDFQRDIAPVFVSRCLECHGPKDAKNDFRIDDMETVLGFVEPGDVEGSTLWTDYLRSEDADMQMPPSSHGGPLSPGEMALINVWISEGANWPEDATVIATSTDMVVETKVIPSGRPTTLLGRVWAFQGYLHPATVHFPIALLLVGGFFVVVGWKFPDVANNIALVCLFIGTATSIAATMMGWSFAERQGYGSWDRIDMDSEIFWHRWSAIIVTLSSIVTSVIAFYAIRGQSERLGKLWKVGLLLVAGMVGAVGHQGGELTYGKTLYQDAFDMLLGTDSKTPEQSTQASAASIAPASFVSPQNVSVVDPAQNQAR